MKRIRMITDIAMTVLLPLLMAYSLIGEKYHEVIGVIMMILFVVHHIFNYRWYKNLFKGRYDIRRSIQVIINISLTILMILQPLSGILISKHLFTFIEIDGSAVFRQIHLFCAYWSFVLMSIHAGMHLNGPLMRLKRDKERLWKVLSITAIVASLYGVFTFFKRDFLSYMFLRSVFVFIDLSEPVLFFLLDHISIMILLMNMGIILTKTGMTFSDRSR